MAAIKVLEKLIDFMTFVNTENKPTKKNNLNSIDMNFSNELLI